MLQLEVYIPIVVCGAGPLVASYEFFAGYLLVECARRNAIMSKVQGFAKLDHFF